jgi:hypothetical protein
MTPTRDNEIMKPQHLNALWALFNFVGTLAWFVLMKTGTVSWWFLPLGLMTFIATISHSVRAAESKL